MRAFVRAMVAVCLASGIWLGPGFAGETGHYVNGVEGIKAGTVPPPGLYYRLYGVSYAADTLKDGDGNGLDVGFDLTVHALVSRIVWVTDIKILGGDFFVDGVLPFIDTDLEIGALELADSRRGLGDINIEPFGLSWHGARHDAAFGLSFYLPTGKYERTEPASPGKDFRTVMLTMGATRYLDGGKAWAASILGRYEIHSGKNDTDVRPGDDFHFEWGISRQVSRAWDVGLAGYCHWQVNDDSGADVTWDENLHDRVFAAGPEVSAVFPSVKLLVSLRSQWEFGAVDRSEGRITTLTLTKIF